MNEEGWASRLRQDDTAALQEVMDAYTAYLCTVARNMAAPALTAQDVEEIVSEAFVRLWTHRNTLDPALSLKGYLLRVTKNLAVDKLRSEKNACLPLVEEIVACRDEVETALERAEAVARLQRHLAALPRQDRDLLLRFYYYHQRTCDIAKAYGIQHGALRTRLSRLRARLKKELEREDRP